MNTHLVDHPGTESSLQRHLVDDHGVLHVVARVGDDGHNGVGAHGVVVQPDVVIVGGTEERRGRSLEPVQLRLWKECEDERAEQDSFPSPYRQCSGSRTFYYGSGSRIGLALIWVTGLVWSGLALYMSLDARY